MADDKITNLLLFPNSVLFDRKNYTGMTIEQGLKLSILCRIFQACAVLKLYFYAAYLDYILRQGRYYGMPEI